MRADVHPKHVSDIERANKDPRLTTVVRLADGLDMTLQDLFRAVDEVRADQRGRTRDG